MGGRGLKRTQLWHAIFAAGPKSAGPALWRTYIERIPGKRRLKGGFCLPYPSKGGDTEAANTFVAGQLKWNGRAFFGKPVGVGLESTKALPDAEDRSGMGSEARRDIFCNNALRLLGISSG